MTRAEAARRMSISVDQVNTAADVEKLALPEVRAAIDNGTIKTIGYAYFIVTPDKDERREGVTSVDRQRKWLSDPKNGLKRRTPKPPRPPMPITTGDLERLSDDQADVIMGKLAPKANRARKPQGERWAIVKLTREEPDR